MVVHRLWCLVRGWGREACQEPESGLRAFDHELGLAATGKNGTIRLQSGGL